jgi:hypothetical protein
MWHPAHTTTFVLPVFEIEQIISQLRKSMSNSTVNLNGGKNITRQIQKQIKNWEIVLVNYRQHNSDLTPMFTVDNLMYLNMTNSFTQWSDGIISDSDLVGVVDGVKSSDDDALTSSSRSVNDGRNVAKFYGDFSQSFQRISDSCNNLIPQYQSAYLKSVCADFSSSHWNGFASLIDGACGMPSTPDAAVEGDGVSSSNPLSNSALIQTLCQERIAAQSADIPGGLQSDGKMDSLIGFMTSTEKYLTFGAKAPIEISWSSSVSDSKSFSSNLEYGGDKGSSVSSSIGGSIVVAVADSSLGSETDKSHSISIGKSSGSSHTYKRSVSIVLGDNDYGKLSYYSLFRIR